MAAFPRRAKSFCLQSRIQCRPGLQLNSVFTIWKDSPCFIAGKLSALHTSQNVSLKWLYLKANGPKWYCPSSAPIYWNSEFLVMFRCESMNIWLNRSAMTKSSTVFSSACSKDSFNVRLSLVSSGENVRLFHASFVDVRLNTVTKWSSKFLNLMPFPPESAAKPKEIV